MGSACVLVAALGACTAPPDDGRRLTVTESSITLVDDHGSTSVAIADLVRIEVRTNDRGPLEDDMFWLLSTASATLEVPSGIPGEEDLWPILKRLPGFDYGKVAEASSSIENRTFLCWAKQGASPPRQE